MSYKKAVAAMFLIGTLSASAIAADLIDGSDPNAVLDVARNYGSASLTTDGQGDPMIEATMGGKDYRVIFYDCENNQNCKAIHFWTWFESPSATADAMVEWNRNERFGKAYLDSDRDPNIEWDINLRFGVTRANLDDSFDWWRIVLEEFQKHLNR
ncbi:MAG: YbjN domain-containing protein [Pseudomonadota bacterium]